MGPNRSNAHLATQVEVVTAKRFHPPVLSNAAYRALGQQANNDPNARAVYHQYLPELNADPTDLLDLLAKHPVIRDNSTGTGAMLATFVTMPSKGVSIGNGNVGSPSDSQCRQTRLPGDGSLHREIAGAQRCEPGAGP